MVAAGGPNPHPASLVGLAAVLAVLGFGAVETVLTFNRPGPVIPHAWADIATGKASAAIAARLDDNLPARDALIMAANGLKYRLENGGPDSVRVGRDGWLYLTDELRVFPHGAEALTYRANLLQAVSEHLRARGVHLLVALVPDKGRVYPAFLPGGHRAAALAGRLGDFARALASRGVDAINLLPAEQAAANTGLAYYRTDTHWNATGARAAAQAIAEHVRALGLDLPPARFVTRVAGPKTSRPGDLLRLMGLKFAPDWLRPAPDVDVPVHTTREDNPGGGALLGAAVVPVTVTGTSFSLRGNFGGYLEQALGAAVLNAAQEGAGFARSTAEYLANPAFANNPPRLLVWEVPERFIQEPVTAERTFLKDANLGGR
ncbi:MAG TPA: hypothetical protein VHN99_11445 [Deinococcales bacterium]|nr:hypothetical protein [Deinococcales bacterium]